MRGDLLFGCLVAAVLAFILLFHFADYYVSYDSTKEANFTFVVNLSAIFLNGLVGLALGGVSIYCFIGGLTG